MRAISKAHNNYSYQTPILNFNDLEEFRNDVIVISGGKDSHVFELIKRKKFDEAASRVQEGLNLVKVT